MDCKVAMFNNWNLFYFLIICILFYFSHTCVIFIWNNQRSWSYQTENWNYSTSKNIYACIKSSSNQNSKHKNESHESLRAFTFYLMLFCCLHKYEKSLHIKFLMNKKDVTNTCNKFEWYLQKTFVCSEDSFVHINRILFCLPVI